jgi:hypothetical protein
VRSSLFGVFLVAVSAFSARGDVLYSFSQPASASGVYATPAITFDFTEPSLLTAATEIPGSSISAPVIRYMGLDLSILSVFIDPGLATGEHWLASGVPFLGIRMGWDSEVVLSEGMCFVPDHYGCTASPAAQIMDHFGTYTVGDSKLTISSTDPPPTATPEPRFETAAGLFVLITSIGVAYGGRRIMMQFVPGKLNEA